MLTANDLVNSLFCDEPGVLREPVSHELIAQAACLYALKMQSETMRMYTRFVRERTGVDGGILFSAAITEVGAFIISQRVPTLKDPT